MHFFNTFTWGRRMPVLSALCAGLTMCGCTSVVPTGSAGHADAPDSAPGMVSVPSHHNVAASLDKLTQIAQSRGLTIFARINHSGDAQKAGLSLRPTQLLILGAAKAGTPLMQARQSTALDLPLKVLAWEDAQGHTWLSYNDPAWLQQRHQFPVTLQSNIAPLAKLVEAAAAP